MKIIRAEHLGMCFGVRDAIALALHHSQTEPLTVLGELVHNETVLVQLRNRGIQFQREPDGVTTGTAMITAHGASHRARDHAQSLGLHLLEATCPLVHHAHRSVTQLVREGYHPVIIGKRGHVEVRGLTEDLEHFDVVLTEDDVDRLAERPRIGIAAQTTQPIDRVERLVERIRCRFPDSDIRFIDTVCQPTKQSQTAAVNLARQCDVVVVVGGANSNNTRELVATCSRHCTRVHHVQSAADLHPYWFAPRDTVGITAGTSTPDEVTEGVEHWVAQLDTPADFPSPSIQTQVKAA
jgi:4-hydroxy-3-methylbut-2-enyl diphosphate reductase